MAVCYVANDQCRRMQGKVFPVWGRRHPHAGERLPVSLGTWRPTVWGGVARGAAPGSGVGDGGRGAGFAVRPPLPSCRAEYASVTAGRMPGVTDRDLRQSEAWLGNRRRLAGAIRAVVTGLPPQAHCRGCGRGGHLARPRHGAGGRMVSYNNRLEGSVLC
jgi:hypothetical protein